VPVEVAVVAVLEAVDVAVDVCVEVGHSPTRWCTHIAGQISWSVMPSPLSGSVSRISALVQASCQDHLSSSSLKAVSNSPAWPSTVGSWHLSSSEAPSQTGVHVLHSSGQSAWKVAAVMEFVQ
jgi:hypothetical protein